MKRIIFIIFITVIFLSLGSKSSYAFDRAAVVNYARYATDPNCCAKIDTSHIGSAPRVSPAPNYSSPAYGQITQAINQIEILKAQMKNWNTK